MTATAADPPRQLAREKDPRAQGWLVTTQRWSEIDGLRALCAASVMFSHWGPTWASPAFIDTGGIGVGFFYAISGFLITNILVNSRDKLVAEGRFWQAVKIFYARRSLRIFPVYYALLVACAVLAALGIVRIEALPWNFAYLTNVYTFAYRHWQPPIVSHLWSLSVEEQFYLLWPAVVFLTPKAALRYVILAAIAFAISFRLGLTLAGFDFRSQTGVLLPACLDSLGMGALLAVLARDHPIDNRAIVWTAIVGVASYAAIIQLCLRYSGRFPGVLIHLSVGLMAFAFLALIVSRKGRGKLAWLNWKPLQYLGTISYGLYLFHQFVAYGVDGMSHKVLHQTLPMWPRLLLCFVVDVGVASASWFLLEKPILSLKSRFDYRQAAAPPRPSQPGHGYAIESTP